MRMPETTCFAVLRPVPAGTTVDALVETLGLPRKEVKIVFVNGRKADLDKGIQGGDRVGIFPPVGGG